MRVWSARSFWATFRSRGSVWVRTGSGRRHVEFVREAVAAGVRIIDTAHLYSGGESEATIGAAGVAGERCRRDQGRLPAGRGPSGDPARADRRESPPLADGQHRALLPAQGPSGHARRGQPRRDRRGPRGGQDQTRRRLERERRHRSNERAEVVPVRRRPEPLQPRGAGARGRRRLLHRRGDRLRPVLPAAGSGWPRHRRDRRAPRCDSVADSARLAPQAFAA